jgi:hypothetical protein
MPRTPVGVSPASCILPEYAKEEDTPAGYSAGIANPVELH